MPNVTPPQGEGWVQFTVKPKSTLPTGTQIKNTAVITFDLNKPLATNTTLNTLDFDPPKTTVPTVLRVPGKDQVSLTWTNDDGKGAGVKNSMVFMASNDGPFTLVAATESTLVSIPVKPGVPYQFYVVAEANVANRATTAVKILSMTTGVNSHDEVPRVFALAQNYPNPFNPSTTISYELPQRTHITMEIMDILGKIVRTIVNEDQPAGSYSAQWDGLNTQGARIVSGVYFCRMRTDTYTAIKKMLLVK